VAIELGSSRAGCSASWWEVSSGFASSFLNVLRSANHLKYFLIGVYGLQIDARMTTREKAEHSVRKTLAQFD
jgi:hypothetical protein